MAREPLTEIYGVPAYIPILVNHHHGLKLSGIWGDGSRSSSDGQRFAVERRSLLGSVYPRYFGYYDRALQQHHKQGAPVNWASSFVSSYASSHPWEDWAETWAHYLHVIDSLETADDCGLGLWPKRSDEPALLPNNAINCWQYLPFDQVIGRWFPLTYVLNNLNRGMGLQDAYPFVLRTLALEKLRFIHEVIGRPAPAARSAAALPMFSNATFFSNAPCW